MLKNLGSERAWVVHGSDGLDEITTSGPTTVAALENGAVRTFEITPEDVGLARAKPEALRGGDAEANAAALKTVLAEQARAPIATSRCSMPRPRWSSPAQRHDLKEGVALAQKSIDVRRGRRPPRPADRGLERMTP